jgi:hypothetical protein
MLAKISYNAKQPLVREEIHSVRGDTITLSASSDYFELGVAI